MQVVTICRIDIFTKYYNESPFYSDISKTQDSLPLPLTPTSFLCFVKQPHFITCWGFLLVDINTVKPLPQFSF